MNTASPRYEILGETRPEYSAILTPGALTFVADLALTFTPRVRQLLAARRERQKRFDAGEKPGFLKETAAVRNGDWTVAPLPRDLLDRRVEITGPVDRKMVINAINSPASCFMADFEDATSPSWRNMVEGQANLRDAVARTVTHEDPHSGKHYALGDKLAVLLVRPRGWHLPESHLRVNGQDVPGRTGLK